MRSRVHHEMTTSVNGTWATPELVLMAAAAATMTLLAARATQSSLRTAATVAGIFLLFGIACITATLLIVLLVHGLRMPYAISDLLLLRQGSYTRGVAVGYVFIASSLILLVRVLFNVVLLSVHKR